MEGSAGDAGPPQLRRRLLFTATIFAGSFQLFLIQPMIARMALPRLGGAPAVWNSAMLVYQALLLAGYAYAHWLTRFSGKAQALVHLALLLLAALFLPIGLSESILPTGTSAFLWVPWLLVSSIGPLFLLVSANAPLLQRWFSLSGGVDPYPLFAASNFGSFAGLIAYPLLLEPLLPVSAQSLLWTGGYAILFVLLGGCALLLTKNRGSAAMRVRREEAPNVRQALDWVWLSFIPSGLMLATTLFITTDIMPMPLLWVIPLGLYLLSFTVAFASRSSVATFFATVAPYLLVPASIALFVGQALPLYVTAGILLAALFAISVACHFRIYQSRPDPGRLTGFYLAIAVGGALGGLFCALIAPLIFDWTYEYPLLLFAAAVTLVPGYSLLVPERLFKGRAAALVIAALSAVILAAAIAAAAIWGRTDDLVRHGSVAALILGPLAIGSRTLLLGTMAAAMIVTGVGEKLKLSVEPGRMTRTYFGIYSIVETNGGRQLLHGTTLHGMQMTTRGWERFPTTYYAKESGVGRALELVPAMYGPQAGISVVGLGTGTLACYKRPRQRWTFFELDSAVADLASKAGRFTFVPLCAPDARIVIGDARLRIAQQPAASTDVLIVDAFSSDAVPLHLLTREAYAAYGRLLSPNGLLLMHISNRHLDLEPVVASVPGWHSRVGNFNPEWDYRRATASEWVALSRSPETIEKLSKAGGEFWQESVKPPLRWTDDQASVLSVLKW